MKKILLVLSLLVLIVGCTQKVVEETPEEQPETQIANPASVYCEEQGGTLEIRTAADGSQSGYCKLKDGTECEEWAYFRGECPVKEEPSQVEETPEVITQEPTGPIKIADINPNPVDTLTDAVIKKWGVDCKKETTDLAKATCVLNWQKQKMHFCVRGREGPNYDDCNMDMEFNEVVPGSFPVSKIMEIKVRDNEVFGECFTFATTYCAIARWNGLKCRVMTAKTIVQDVEEDWGEWYCGTDPEDALLRDNFNKLNYDCEEWKSLTWSESTLHYWAEVLIGDEWQAMEDSEWSYNNVPGKLSFKGKDTGW